ncbi:MAG: hypothetical protein JWN04_2682 [Myxococcaceae bacterium]|nr:hypothetical protein [Myxococcaceae bacterium]
MRAHWFGASSSIVALVLGLSGAQAQDAAGGTVGVQGGVTVPTAGAPTAAGTTSVEVGPVQTRAAVTPAEQLAQADVISRRADQLAQRLSKMLDESRRDKDILRANCVNRKLTEVNANTRNIQQRAQALRDANATNDEARRGHEFTVLTVLGQKLESLDQEATQCLGQSVYEPGASQVVTTIQAGSPTLTTTIVNPASGATPTISVPPPNLNTDEMSGFR